MKIQSIIPGKYIAALSVAIIAVIGISVGGCQEQPEKYTGPVEKITLAAYAGGAGCCLLKLK